MFENGVCFCGSDTFRIRIDVGNFKNHITLICSKCNCNRKVTTPGVACEYAIEPRLEGFFVDRATGRMSLEIYHDG